MLQDDKQMNVNVRQAPLLEFDGVGVPSTLSVGVIFVDRPDEVFDDLGEDTRDDVECIRGTGAGVTVFVLTQRP